MLNKNPIIKGTIILTIASLLSRIIGFLYRIFLSNLIGAKGMGVFQLIFPVLVFCIALSCGGIQIAVSRFVAESKSRKECFLVLISSIIMSLSLSFITLGVLYFFAEPVSLFIIKNKSCTELLKYASFTIPLATFHACITGYYLGFKKTFVPAWSGVVEQIAKVISLFILWLVWVEKGISITPVIAVYSMVISELCGVIFCLIAIFGERFFAFKISEIFSVMKKMFSVSYVLTLNKIMLTFLQTLEAVIFPTVLLKSGLSLSDSLSIYGILTGMALPVVTFPSAINTSVSTMIASYHSRCKFRKRRFRHKKNNRIFYLVFYDYGDFLCWCFSFLWRFYWNKYFQAASCRRIHNDSCLALPFSLSFHYTWLHLTRAGAY